MSEIARPRIAPLAARIFYSLAIVAALFELGVFYLMLHPNVSQQYRGYYIDRTTACLYEPTVLNSFTLGSNNSYRRSGGLAAQAMWTCGWNGPASVEFALGATILAAECAVLSPRCLKGLS